MSKKFLSLLFSVIIFCGCFTTFSTAKVTENSSDFGIAPAFVYTQDILSKISISSKTATCKSTVLGVPGTATKIVITQYLQKKNGDSWSNVQSWSKTYDNMSAVFTNTKASLSSGTYRTKTNAKVYSGTKYETINSYSVTVTC